MYTGTIACEEHETVFLSSLGITLHSLLARDQDFLTFQCSLSQDAMLRLDPLWGRFIWAFTPVPDSDLSKSA